MTKGRPALPSLKPCPGCGLGLQRGRGPHGLAFHECREQDLVAKVLREGGSLTPELVEQALLAQIVGDVRSGKVKATDALEALSGLHKAKNPPRLGRPPKEQAAESARGPSTSSDMLKFLQG